MSKNNKDMGVKEGYTITRGIDRDRYGDRSEEGLEGPFQSRNGKVYYYDSKAGQAYDPDTDMYIEYDDLRMMDESIEPTGILAKIKRLGVNVKRAKARRGDNGLVIHGVVVRDAQFDYVREKMQGMFPGKTINVSAYEIRVNNDGVTEGMADDFAAMASDMGLNPKIRKPGERQADKPATQQTHSSLSQDEINKLENRLKTLYAAFDKNYQRSDDYAVYSKHDAIAQEIRRIKATLTSNKGLSEMDNRTPSGDRREQRANSPESKAKQDKEQQARLKQVSPEMRKKLRLPEQQAESNLESNKDNKIINYVITNSGDAIAESPGAAPTVGDIIIDYSDKFWDSYRKIYEPLINKIMQKEYGSKSLDDYLQQTHADYWRDKTSELKEGPISIVSEEAGSEQQAESNLESNKANSDDRWITKPASRTDKFTRKGGDGMQYLWIYRGRDGSKKLAWAESKTRVADSIGTDGIIAGYHYSAKKVERNSDIGQKYIERNKHRFPWLESVNEDQGVESLPGSGSETVNPTDKITMDVPLFIRMLEYAREDAASDEDLHMVADKIVELSGSGETLKMKHYNDIVSTASAPKAAVPGTPEAEPDRRMKSVTERVNKRK